MTIAARTTPPLIMAWDFFIFFSSRLAAGGRDIAVAKSDMMGLQVELGSVRLRFGEMEFG
jgi:hypothetical protein